MEEVDALKKMSHAAAAHKDAESAAIKAAVEQLKHSGGGSSTLFPLAVCGQALVVAALLFYSMAGGGNRRHSHLP